MCCVKKNSDMAYDVFISYRRETGADDARLLQQALRARGYNVFFDYDSLRDGKFDKKIFEAIDEAPVFVLMLTERSLDRCVNENDWVRLEIERAAAKGRKIISVVPSDQKWSFPEQLPDSLLAVKTEQASELNKASLFEESIDKMVEERFPVSLKIKRKSKSVDVTSQNVTEAGRCADVKIDSLVPDNTPLVNNPWCRDLVSRRVVCGIVALLALLGGTVCAGVCWYNERRAKNSVVEIRIESTVLKEKMGSIPRKDGFGQKIDAVSDECRKAEAFYGAGRWHESAVVFTNYVQHCKELVDLDRERQSAERAKEPAEKAQQQAKSLEAMMYAAAGWSLAVQTFEKADDEFRRMEFAASRASYEMSTRQFEECAKVAKSEKIRLAQEEEQRRLEEQRRREAEKLEAERRQKEELHRREAQRQDAENLAKIRAGIKVKVREAKRDMERIADFRADPVGFTKHIDNADGKWKYIEVVETNPATVAEAEAVLKLVEECESEIADVLMWLKANKAARDEAKNVEKEIVRYIDPELRRVEASRYAKEAFLAGKRLRDDGNSALAQGDFLIAKDRLLAAKKKLLEAMAEAKSPWASDVWKKIEPEVLSIRLEYEKHVSRNRLVVHVPQARLDLGDAQLTLDLMKGTNVVDQIKDVTLTSDGDNPDYRRAEMKCLARRTKGIDAYVLHISYQSLPIDLRFIPTVGVNIEAGKFAQDVSSFALASVSVMGERREFLELDAQIQGDVIMSISNNLNCAARSDGGKYLWALGLLGPLLEAYSTKDRVNSNEIVRGLEFSQTLTEVRTNGLLHVQANAQDYNISYTNETPSKCRVALDATFLNPCGAQIFAARDEKKLGAWEGGASILSMPQRLKGCELPSFVILKWTRK